MRRFIRNTNHNNPEINHYKLEEECYIFLDRRNSQLISRIEKKSQDYESVALYAFQNGKVYLPENLAKPYGITRYGVIYNKDKDYFIQKSLNVGKDMTWRNHLDLIDYVEKTNQNGFEIIDIPEEKNVTAIHTEQGGEIIVVSDRGVQVF